MQWEVLHRVILPCLHNYHSCGNFPRTCFCSFFSLLIGRTVRFGVELLEDMTSFEDTKGAMAVIWGLATRGWLVASFFCT